MKISSCLRIRPGLTALIGGGGKTSLMYRLAEELGGTVILCTSTRIYPPTQYPVVTDAAELGAALGENRVVCVGTPAEHGKLAAPALPFSALTELAEFVLAEADGAKGLPLKAHLPHEPVIPEHANNTVLVVGADGFDQPIRAVCHRFELWAKLAGTVPEEAATVERIARVIQAEGFGDRIYVNKAETAEAFRAAAELAELLRLPLTAGSLRKEEYRCLY